ncbi:MAG: hypothetical protein Q8P20_01795 [bacterium]|nr:hypothetical protein [bacterium]
MNSNNKTKFSFIIGIILILVVIAILFFVLLNKAENTPDTNVVPEYITDTPGSTSVECTSNTDCENICKDDGCLISSCVKGQNGDSGKCACFDICGS